MEKVNLSKYDNSWYYPGRNVLIRLLWYYVNLFFLKSGVVISSKISILILRLFGAKIGKGVNIKPGVDIKYPWNLEVEEYTWIGENVWIDNLVKVKIGANACLSQGAMILTGNHNFNSSSFELIVGEIVLEDGVWIGAKSMVTNGVTCGEHSILAVNSVASKNLESRSIYRGNPAVKVGTRNIQKESN